MIDLTEFVIEKLSAISDVIVSSAYFVATPEYPMITVSQIDNFEVLRYTTLDTKERVSEIPFQIDCYARNMTIGESMVTAAKAAEYYRTLADDIMQIECGMRRTSAPLIVPHSPDFSIMRAIARYNCEIDIDSLVIHKI